MMTYTGSRVPHTLLVLALLAAGCGRDAFGELDVERARSVGGRPGNEADAGASGSGAKGGSAADSGGPKALGGVVSEPDDDANFVFDQEQVRTYRITMDPEHLEFVNSDPVAESMVPATVEFEGKTYKTGFRYKGSFGAWLSPCTPTSQLTVVTGGGPGGPKTGKCSMKLAFDFEDDEARFFGLKKLNFHAMNMDRSMLRERLGYALFREFGVAAPRAVHARVFINGKLEGLFIAVEQIDGRFTRSRFVEGGEGNLYKEVWPMFDDEETYLNALESNKDEAVSAAPMVRLKNALATGSSAVERLIDRDYTLRYLAADRVLVNDDGAAHWWCSSGGQCNNPGGIGNHNYYWYQAMDGDRLWIVPWDLDNSLSGNSFVRVSPEWRTPAGACNCGGFPPQRPTSCDPLFNVWASWSNDYEAAVDRFIAGPLDPTKLEFLIRAIVNQLEPYVTEAQGIQLSPTPQQWIASVNALNTTFAQIRQNRGAAY